MSAHHKVFFDESGNTGPDLLNSADPIFVLSSCRFTPEEENALLLNFAAFQGPELKYSRLRKSPAGERMVLSFLACRAVRKETVAIFPVHKPFMVVCKYCDLVLEPSAREFGIDFYKDGMNLATANLLTTTMPVLLNRHTWNSFLTTFVRVLRERSQAAFRDWIRQAELIHNYLQGSDPETAHWFAPAILLRRDPDKLLNTLGDHELDPLVTSYYALANHWSIQLGQPFEFCADHSKPLLNEASRLMALSSPDLLPVTVGYDRRKMSFPLKMSAVTAADSKLHRQIQLADIIAGAAAASFKSKARLVEGSFLNSIMKAFLNKNLVIDTVWPGHEVTPEALDTVCTPGANEIDLPTYTGRILGGDPRTRKQS